MTIIYSAALANDKLDDIETQLQKARSTYNQQELPLREFRRSSGQYGQNPSIKTNSADAMVKVSCLRDF